MGDPPFLFSCNREVGRPAFSLRSPEIGSAQGFGVLGLGEHAGHDIIDAVAERP
jgi:hypothetical protein